MLGPPLLHVGLDLRFHIGVKVGANSFRHALCEFKSSRKCEGLTLKLMQDMQTSSSRICLDQEQHIPQPFTRDRGMQCLGWPGLSPVLSSGAAGKLARPESHVPRVKADSPGENVLFPADARQRRSPGSLK